jgi:hypothetical protein
MRGGGECSADVEVLSSEMSEFDRILDEFGTLVDRLRCVREESIAISDALIGVQDSDKADDCAKPTSHHYFVARCFDLIVDFRDEVGRLEETNAKLLHSVKVE